MTKNDWLKLTTPASIVLLALSVFTARPVIKVEAEIPDGIKVLQSEFDLWDVKLHGSVWTH